MSHFTGKNFNHGAMPTAVSTGTRVLAIVICEVLTQICIDERHSPHTVQNQVPRNSGPGPINGPGDSFHRYLEREADKVKRGESQREDAHEVLIFVSLLHFPAPTGTSILT
jgi:hypothetical protein